MGLPPKKPGCYEADYADCRAVAASWIIAATDAFGRRGMLRRSPRSVSSLAESIPDMSMPDPFEGTPSEYFQIMRDDASAPAAVFRVLLEALDGLSAERVRPGMSAGALRAAASGIESALMDCWALHVGVSVSTAIGASHLFWRIALFAWQLAGLELTERCGPPLCCFVRRQEWRLRRDPGSAPLESTQRWLRRLPLQNSVCRSLRL